MDYINIKVYNQLYNIKHVNHNKFKVYVLERYWKYKMDE